VWKLWEVLREGLLGRLGEGEAALEDDVSLDDEVVEGAGASRTRPLYPCGRPTFKPWIVRPRNVEMLRIEE
jgi:hypothetical protein